MKLTRRLLSVALASARSIVLAAPAPGPTAVCHCPKGHGAHVHVDWVAVADIGARSPAPTCLFTAIPSFTI